ncbi:hypothetical protein E2C01_070740 [Portunus trituberculatus]|uniref:Uncharacterized protein n=1 Tax=Portunus trituberculatus TaxID=210409 RepID=A0A5B7HUZ6_PORTR|nr:hypothetical protein [Portunus trituberculatus]
MAGQLSTSSTNSGGNTTVAITSVPLRYSPRHALISLSGRFNPLSRNVFVAAVTVSTRPRGEQRRRKGGAGETEDTRRAVGVKELSLAVRER